MPIASNEAGAGRGRIFSVVFDDAIYFVDVRGLVASPAGDTAASFGTLEDPRDQFKIAFEERNLTGGGSQELADASGGFSVRNTNDLGAGIDRIAEESRVYLLGFYPPEGKSEREWRKLKVEVKRPGLTVRARRGYTLRPPGPAKPEKKDKAPSVDPAIVRALDSAHPVAGLAPAGDELRPGTAPQRPDARRARGRGERRPGDAFATRGRARRPARRERRGRQPRQRPRLPPR